MMIETFPPERPFLPASLRWRLMDAVEEGAAPYGLPTIDVSVDGGGWWTASLLRMQGGTGYHHRTLRAMALRLRGGRAVNVPWVELARIGTPPPPVRFSDGASFDDGSRFVGQACVAELAEPVRFRDDEATIRILTPHQLIGGDMFSIDRGPLMGDELHGTDQVEALGDGRWRVRIGPQFRRSHPAGTPVNFSDPKCAMKLQDPNGGLWPTFERNWIARADALFVEKMYPGEAP